MGADFQIGVDNRDYHYLSQFDIVSAKRDSVARHNASLEESSRYQHRRTGGLYFCIVFDPTCCAALGLRPRLHRGHSRDKPSSLSWAAIQKEHWSFGEDETFSDGRGLDNSGPLHLRPHPNAVWISRLLKALGRIASTHFGGRENAFPDRCCEQGLSPPISKCDNSDSSSSD